MHSLLFAWPVVDVNLLSHINLKSSVYHVFDKVTKEILALCLIREKLQFLSDMQPFTPAYN
jgi:hypothetical protein